MIAKVALKEQIINECLRLHYNNKPEGRKLKQRLFWIPLILIMLGAALLIDEARHHIFTSNSYMALVYITFAIAYYYYVRYRLMRAGGRMLKNLGANASYTLEVTSEQLVTSTAHEQYTVSWSMFTGALISAQHVLIYQSNNTFTMLHSSFFEPGDFEKFKAEVRQNINPVKEV